MTTEHHTRALELPELPSDLLATALSDLERVEVDTHYVVNMREWHAPSVDGTVCYVCLAGALLTRVLEPDEACGDPATLFDTDAVLKLMAVDLFRCGSVRTALDYLGLSPAHAPPDRRVVTHDEDPELFRLEMRILVGELRECGL